jgi:hypothetical protein
MQDAIRSTGRKTVAAYKAEIAELLEGMRLMNQQIEADHQVSLRLREETQALKAETRKILDSIGRSH